MPQQQPLMIKPLPPCGQRAFYIRKRKRETERDDEDNKKFVSHYYLLQV